MENVKPPLTEAEVPRPLPDRPNLRHLKDQAKGPLKAGGAESVTDAQFKIARLYGFASWPKFKAQVDSLDEIGVKQAIDTNEVERVKTLMTRNPTLLLDRGADVNACAFAPSQHPRQPLRFDGTLASDQKSSIMSKRSREF